MTANCTICSGKSSARTTDSAQTARRAASGSAAPKRSSRARSGGLVTRKLARAQDDGYRNQLAPGLRAADDALRLGLALVEASERLRPPGPYEELAAEPDRELATRLALVYALGAEPEDPTLAAYDSWVARSGGTQEIALTGDAQWSPQRRFARAFERLSMPGMTRMVRYQFLVILGTSGLYEIVPDKLFFGAGSADDATLVAAKRCLVSGDAMLLERRARDLAQACDVPLAALDRALPRWDDATVTIEAIEDLPGAIRNALAL